MNKKEELTTLSKVKLDRAHELRQELLNLCFRYIELQDKQIILKMASLVGEFSNNLRSVLNYSMSYFIENKLKPALPTGKPSHSLKGDFPWANSKAQFDSKPNMAFLSTYFPSVYQFLEELQPYHSNHEWLRWLMVISNTDKHESLITVTESSANDIDILGIPKPIWGDNQILFLDGNQYKKATLPFYYEPYGAFASKQGKWVFFLLAKDEVINQYPGLMRFLEHTPQRIETIFKDFYQLI